MSGKFSEILNKNYIFRYNGEFIMIKQILFDLDNTLMDFNKAEYNAFQEVMLHYGIVFTESVFKEYEIINANLWRELEQGLVTMDYVQKKRFAILFKHLNLLFDGEQANEYFHKMLQNQCELVPYAEEVCSVLSQQYQISIVTNGVYNTQINRIHNSVIDKFITNIFISELIGVEKPDIRFFECVIDKLQCDKDDVLIVGDSLSSDIQGGINAGIQTCWYNPSEKENKSSIIPNYMISDLRELYSCI